MGTISYRINGSKSRKKWIVFALAAILLACAVSGYLLLRSQQSQQDQGAQKARDEAQTTSSKDVDAKTRSTDDNATPGVDIKQDVPEAPDMTVSISEHSQSNGQVRATAVVNKEAGECVFTYSTPEDRPVVRTTNISSGTCNSSIPEVEFARLGVWNLNVTAYVNGRRAEANRNVTIN